MSWRKFWPIAELRTERERSVRLERENGTLTTALSNATSKASQLQERLNEALARECPACKKLEQVINFHVLAAGSRVKMFDEVGPTLPPPKEFKPEAMRPEKIRASRLAHSMNSTFLREALPQFAHEELKFEQEMERAAGEPQAG